MLKTSHAFQYGLINLRLSAFNFSILGREGAGPQVEDRCPMGQDGQGSPSKQLLGLDERAVGSPSGVQGEASVTWRFGTFQYPENVFLQFWATVCTTAQQWLRRATVAIIDMGQKRRCCCAPFAGEAGSQSNTICGLGLGLLPYQVTYSSIHPFGHNKYRPKIGGVPALGGSCVPI